jgi:hypothetical protein
VDASPTASDGTTAGTDTTGTGAGTTTGTTGAAPGTGAASPSGSPASPVATTAPNLITTADGRTPADPPVPLRLALPVGTGLGALIGLLAPYAGGWRPGIPAGAGAFALRTAGRLRRRFRR